MSRIILHSDINSCFANIECLYNPELRGKPVSVCGSIEQRHGIVLASTIEAKRCGVKTGEAVWQAKLKCPNLITIAPNYDRYVKFSKLSREIYAEYTDMVEPFGLDEAFLDVTGHPLAKDGGRPIAEELRQRVKSELGITVSVGAADNKIFAKLGSDIRKPDAVTVITQENYRGLVWPLPVESLLYVGHRTRDKLYGLGITTIGQLAMCDVTVLTKLMGKTGELIWTFANGLDRTPVSRIGQGQVIKSISNGTTPPRDMRTLEDGKIILCMLSDTVSERLREHGFKAGTVHINARYTDLHTFSHQKSFTRPTDISSHILSAGTALLQECWNLEKPLRSITIGVSDFSPSDAPVQLTVFDDEEKLRKLEHLDRAVDNIRRRFGYFSISRAVTSLDKSLGHVDTGREHVSLPAGYFKELI